MGKSVFEKSEADELAVAYVPRKFPLTIGSSAKSFHAMQSGTGRSPTSFQIDRIVAERTGVAELERLSIEEQVERGALSRLKELQENAYKEAHELGLHEGLKRAYSDASADISARMDRLDSLLDAIEKQQADLMSANESRLVRLAFAIATRLAMDEIRDRPELVAGILRSAIEEAQVEERIVARVSPEDREHVEASRKTLGRTGESATRVRIEEDSGIQPGGCVIETNFGSVDATVEQRVKRLWDALADKLPKAGG